MDWSISSFWLYILISYLTVFNTLYHGCQTGYMIQKSPKYGNDLILTNNDRIFIEKLRKSTWQECPKRSPRHISYISMNWHRLSRKVILASAKLHYYLKNYIPINSIVFNLNIALFIEWFLVAYLILRVIYIGILVPLEFIIRFIFVFLFVINGLSKLETLINFFT